MKNIAFFEKAAVYHYYGTANGTLQEDLRQAIDELLKVKKRTTEGKENLQMPLIKGFIESETVRMKKIAALLNAVCSFINTSRSPSRMLSDPAPGRNIHIYRR